jgi:hypothetical protein
MSVLTSQEHRFNIVPLGATLLFGIPAVVALICALMLRDGAWYSGFWFIYIASRDVALFGVLLSLAVTVGVRHAVSELTLFLMGASIVGAACLLWYAMHLELLFLVAARARDFDL